MKTSKIPLVAHVVNALRIGGLENGVVNLINHMPAERYRHAVICITDYSDFSKRIAKSDVPIVALHKQPGKDPKWYYRLWRALRELRPDIIHTRNLATIESQVIAAFAGVKGRVHGEHGWDMYDLNGGNKKYRLMRRMISPLVGRFIALSGELESYLTSAVHVPGSRVVRICNGVDSERFQPRLAGARLPFDGAREQLLIVGTVGRMEPVKDPLNLVDAFSRAIGTRPEMRQRLRLVMIGDGSLHSSVVQSLAASGLSDLVWLPGHREDIPELMAQFDLFVLPSKAEGISNTILEAMACALPVVATDVGGNSELLCAGENAILVPASDSGKMSEAILHYADDRTLMREHGECSRRLVERSFSLDAMVRSYMRVYDQVLV